MCRLLEGTVECVLLRTEPLLCEYYSWCAILLGAASGFRQWRTRDVGLIGGRVRFFCLRALEGDSVGFARFQWNVVSFLGSSGGVTETALPLLEGAFFLTQSA